MNFLFKNRFLTSFVTSIALLLIYAVGLATATFVEKYHGTAAAKALIYYSPLFFVLQLLMVVNFVAIAVKHQFLKNKRYAMMLVHCSFIVILLGATVSFFFGEEGILHIREGETTDQMVVATEKGNTIKTLPFTVELEDFKLTRYPGSSSPSSYESKVVVRYGNESRPALIYMNNVLDVKGYRLFQASYDPDELGTVLSVNRDVAGRNITYVGYLLLVAGLVWSLIGKNTRFRKLSGRLKEIRRMSVAALLLAFLSVSAADAKGQADAIADIIKNHPVSKEHAARFGALPMQSTTGRMMPINTFSSEVLRKIHKDNKIFNLNPDQFLLSLIMMPDMWTQVDMVAVPSKELSDYYDLPEGQCSYYDVFDTNGNYKFAEKLEEAYEKMPAQRTRFDKDLIKLDEQVNILHQLLNGQMLNIFPLEGDTNNAWYAPGDDLSGFQGKDSMFVSRITEWYASELRDGLKTGDYSKADEVLGMIETYQKAKNKTVDIDEKKIQAELKYNRLDIFRYVKILYLSLGGLLLVICFCLLFKSGKWLSWVFWTLGAAVLVTFHFQMVGMSMRWYIGGYAPWSNSYETMVYVAWATVCGGLLFMRRSKITFALATLFAGIIMFVSGLNWMDPQINPLVPVLKSPWLMFHVAVIVAAYGFFGISCLLGLTNLCLMSFATEEKRTFVSGRIKELTIVNEMSMTVGLVLMTVGTFLGAVWANESWGRYWGWDPKETWALITMVVYAVVTHLHLVGKKYNDWLFNLCAVVAFASVLMTFFGVNYFLSGMHSYGQNDNIHGIFAYLYLALAIVVVLALISLRGWRKMGLNTNNIY